MDKEFIRLFDMYAEPDKSGKQKLIKKNVKQRLVLDTDKIVPFEYIDNKGKIIKSKCSVKIADNDYQVLLFPYEKLKELKLPIIVKGFRKCIKE